MTSPATPPTSTPPSALAEQLRRIKQHLADPANRPLPQVTTETRPTLPGWALRLALLTLAPLLLFTAASRTPDLPLGLTTTVAILCTGLLLAHPTPTTAGGTIVVAGILLWGFSSQPFDPWALAVALLAHLLTRITWWTAHVPLRGHVEISALLTDWRRDIAVLAATGLLGALAMLASGASVPGAVLLAALGIAGIAVLALATSGSPRDHGQS